MFTNKDTVLMKVVSIISAVVLVVGVFPITASAATIFTEDFGTGSSANDISNWDESGSDNSATTRATAASSGNDSISTNGGRFAVIGMDEWICRSISTTGYNTLTMSYVWRGDDNAENDDFGKIEYKIGGSCDDSSGWTNLKSHDMSIDNSWSTQSAFSLPNALNNTTFNLRVRADSSNNGEDFRIDGIVINGSVIVVDTDGDTVPDSSDNCPSVSNTNQANNDGDSQGDLCDTDDDNDTVADTSDNCDFDANLDQLDSDADQFGDECDDSPFPPIDTDGDNDGVDDEDDNCPINANEDQADNDTDGAGDICDNDDDNDSVEDTSDVCPLDANDECDNSEGDACTDNGGEWIELTCIGLEDDIICEVFELLNLPLPDQCGEPEVTECPEGWSGVYPECIEPVVDVDLCPEEGFQTETNLPCATVTPPSDEENSNGSETPQSSRGHVDAMCNNNEDDDNDGMYDVNDSDCENADDNSEGPSGDVLGASTSCAATITSYMGAGKDNNPEQVKLLQEFLNTELGLDIEVNGEFDRPTLDAVKDFQIKYSEEVLTPWGIFTPTGYSYKTTLRMIQMLMCPGTDIPMPELE